MARLMLLALAVLHLAASFQAPHPELCPGRREQQRQQQVALFAAPSTKDTDKKSSEGWNGFKKVVYGSLDGATNLASKIAGEKEATTGRVEEGYSSFEESLLRSSSPGKQLMSEYQSRASTLGIDKTAPVAASQTKKDSGFVALKKKLYFVADALAGDMAEEAPVSHRIVPVRRSLAQDLNKEDLLSPNPIKRFQAEQELREREAQKRAQVTNQKIRAKKEDLYKLVDAFQAAVDTIPENIDVTGKAVKDVAKFFKSVPNRVKKTVEEVKAIPNKVEVILEKTKESAEKTVDMTRKVVEDVIDIPNKMTKKVEDTKRAIAQTKESIDESVTNVKVLLRLEKPEPKPPKLPPPKPKNAQEIALDLAGKAAGAAGKVAWWATKGTANMAWSGAQAAFEKGKEAVQGKPAPTKGALDTDAVEKGKEAVQGEPAPTKGATDTDAVEKEVADALKLAEASLKLAEESLSARRLSKEKQASIDDNVAST
jgi:hypothetical protein